MRLHLKITLWIVVIFLSVGGVSIYALLFFQRAAGLQQFETMAQALTETILHSLPRLRRIFQRPTAPRTMAAVARMQFTPAASTRATRSTRR